MSRNLYTTDLTDAQWQAFQQCLPKAINGRTGRPRKHDLGEVINALLYLLHNGCIWRDLPHDLPPWTNVYDQFCRWREDGTIEPASIGDRDVARKTLGFCRGTYSHLTHVWADGGYSGPLVEQVATTYGITLQIVKRSDEQKDIKGFVLLRRRWVVELPLPGWASAAWSKSTRRFPKAVRL